MTQASSMVPAGTWVEIERVLLTPEQRTAALPPDTRQHPYVLRVHGFLVADATVGEQVVVRSLIGREHHGVLCEAAPEYTHSFGPTVPELLRIGALDGEAGA